jgi:PAS domain S-box-containing protein
MAPIRTTKVGEASSLCREPSVSLSPKQINARLGSSLVAGSKRLVFVKIDSGSTLVDAGLTTVEAPSAPLPTGQRKAIFSAFYGAVLGLVPYIASLLLSPSHRSPYLLAYPAVILSAWTWGLPGAIACASVSGAIIEHFIFTARQIDVAPSATGWMARLFMFLAGSILVGFLTRSAALQRERIATASVQQKLALVEAERKAAGEREQAAELLLENEVRTHMALDGANAGLWERDLIREKSKWSTGFSRLHGLAHDGIASYEVWRNQVHSEDIDSIEKEIRKAIADVGTFDFEYRVVLPEGEVRWVACQGTASAGQDGNAEKITGYCGDVTRRKLADQAILKHEKLAVAGRLSAAIAHEVNNPLETVTNLLYLLRRGNLDQEQTAYLDEAMQQVRRVSQVASQTLRLSRSSNRNASCKPSELIENTLLLLRPKLQLAQVEVRTEIRQDPQFSCSPGEIQQVLINLINNSIEAMAGSGKIRIRASASPDWSNRARRGVRITVADTGSGMSRETSHRMREAFFTTKEGTGTGLGMWIVSELMVKHDGKISVSSSMHPDHHGTVLSLFLPTDRSV